MTNLSILTHARSHGPLIQKVVYFRILYILFQIRSCPRITVHTQLRTELPLFEKSSCAMDRAHPFRIRKNISVVVVFQRDMNTEIIRTNLAVSTVLLPAQVPHRIIHLKAIYIFPIPTLFSTTTLTYDPNTTTNPLPTHPDAASLSHSLSPSPQLIQTQSTIHSFLFLAPLPSSLLPSSLTSPKLSHINKK